MGVQVNCELLTIHEHLYDYLIFCLLPNLEGTHGVRNVDMINDQKKRDLSFFADRFLQE